MKRSKTSLDFFIFPAISWNANSSQVSYGTYSDYQGISQGLNLTGNVLCESLCNAMRCYETLLNISRFLHLFRYFVEYFLRKRSFY